MRDRFATQDAREWPGLGWEGSAFGVARAKALASRVGGKASLLSDGIVSHQRAIGVVASAHRAIGVQDEHTICHGVEGRLEETCAFFDLAFQVALLGHVAVGDHAANDFPRIATNWRASDAEPVVTPVRAMRKGFDHGPANEGLPSEYPSAWRLL